MTISITTEENFNEKGSNPEQNFETFSDLELMFIEKKTNEIFGRLQLMSGESSEYQGGEYYVF